MVCIEGGSRWVTCDSCRERGLAPRLFQDEIWLYIWGGDTDALPTYNSLLTELAGPAELGRCAGCHMQQGPMLTLAEIY